MTRRPLLRFFTALPLAVACGCGACEPKEHAGDGGEAGPAASASSANPFASGHHPPHPPPKAPSLCRAATVVGGIGTVPLSADARRGLDAGAPADVDAGLTMASEVPNNVWLDLGAGARLATRDPVSTREAEFLGPARVRACVDHEEESWVVRGMFESVLGSGERPGGEEWVATPHGIIRYAAAGARISVSRDATQVVVGKGTAYLWPAADATARATSEAGAPVAVADEGWMRLDAGTTATVKPTKAVDTQEAAQAAADRCAGAAKTAHELAEQIAQGEGGLAELAPEHVIARRVAHAACHIAELRASAFVPASDREPILAGVRNAEAMWRALGEPAKRP